MAKTIQKLKNKYWLIGIFLLSFLIRVYRIEQIPYGFDGDEAAFGYYAYSLVHNLSDEYGNKLPLYFPSIGDYKYPVYSYLSTVPVFLMGLTVFSTRFLSVVCGSLMVLVIYFLVFEIFNNRNLAIVASLITAFSPYAILFSRGAYESNVATFFLTLVIFIVVYSLKRKEFDWKIYLYFLGAFLASIFTYSSTRVFYLLFFPLILLISKFSKSLKSKQFKILLKIALVIVVATSLSLLDPRGRVRADDIGILRDPWPNKYLVESIHEDGLYFEGKNILVTRIFHNKVVAYGLSVTKRYLEHFDPIYLFFQSNPNMPKYSVPDVGLFYFFEIITIVVGIYSLSKFKDSKKWIVVIWALIAPIPSSLSIETPNPIRALIGLPALIILSSLGTWFFCELMQKFKKIGYLIFGVTLLLGFSYFWHQYMVHDHLRQPWRTDGGVEEMIKAVNGFGKNFDKIVIKGDPYIHFLFFNKVTPQEFLADSDIDSEIMGKWERVNSFGKVIFKMPYDCPKIGRENVLYVCQGEEIPQNSILHEAIYFSDGKPAFLLISFVPYSERKNEDLPERVHRMVDTDLSYPEALLSEESGRYW